MGFTCKANVRFKGAQLACGDEFFQGVEACRVDPLPVLQGLIGPRKHTVHVACIGPDEWDDISMNCVRQHTFDRPKCDLETTLIRYSPHTHTRARARAQSPVLGGRSRRARRARPPSSSLHTLMALTLPNHSLRQTPSRSQRRCRKIGK